MALSRECVRVFAPLVSGYSRARAGWRSIPSCCGPRRWLPWGRLASVGVLACDSFVSVAVSGTNICDCLIYMISIDKSELLIIMRENKTFSEIMKNEI